MNATALNRSSSPLQAEKPIKTGANKAQGDGSEPALFSGVMQQYLDVGQQNQGSESSKTTEGHKDLADGSLTAIEAKLSTSMNLSSQSGLQVVGSAPQSVENTAQGQKLVGATTTTATEQTASALSGLDAIMDPLTQNLSNANDQRQVMRGTEPVVVGNASVEVNQLEMVTATLNASGHPKATEDDSVTKVLKTMEGLPETTGQDSSLRSKLSTSQGLINQAGQSSGTEPPQNENAALNPEMNAIESTEDPKDQTNPKLRSEAAVTARTTAEGLQSQKASPSKQSSSIVQTVSEVMGSQPSQISTLEEASLSPQLPKSASVRELPAIWTQHAQLLRAGETKTLRMMLNPEQLGALEIELSLKNGVLSGIVSVETELAHDLIQKQLPQFLSTLDSKQIASGSFEMHYRGENGGFTESSEKDNARNQFRQSNSAERSEVDQDLTIPQELARQNVNHKRIDLLA